MQPQTSPTPGGDEEGGGHESSSCSSLPDLIPAGTTKQPSVHTTAAGSRLDVHDDSISDSNPSLKFSTSSSSSSSRTGGNGGNYSQASTALADEVYQSESRRESSDDGMILLKKKSSSSSGSTGKSRSDTSSSLYPASNASSLASSLSSNASSGVSPAFHPHALECVKEDIVERDEELCSQDLFADKEDSNATISSQEVSRISTPQDRSTPVDNKQKQAKFQDANLYKQALTRTSTPLDSQELHTPPSHDGFNCLQFSGTSSSSGPKSVSASESFAGAPMIIPSSPTEQSIRYTAVSTTGSGSASSEMINPSPSSFHCRSMTVSSTPEEEEMTANSFDKKHSVSTTGSGSASLEMINPSPSSFQCRSMTVSSTPEEEELTTHSSDKKHPSNLDKDNEEFDGLPLWQQQLLAKQQVQEEVSMIITSTPSDTSSSSNSCDKELTQEHPWQSVPLDSSRSESSLVGTHKEKHSKHVKFLMDESPSVSKSDEVVAPKNDNSDSLSPSSFVIDEQQGLAKIAIPKTIHKTVCSQPELSEDLFGASSYSTQENNKSSINEMKSDSPVSQPPTPPLTSTNEEQTEDSQEFDLHLTQSQVESPPLIPEVLFLESSIIPTTSTSSGRESLLAEPNPSLAQTTTTKQPSLPETPSVPLTEADVAITTTTKSPMTDTTSVTHPEANIGDIIVPLGSLLKNQGKDLINPMFYKSLTQHTISDTASSQASSKHDTEPVEVTQVDHSNQKHDINSSNKPVVPSLFSELSSESVTGSGFHFSLPISTAPLRPVTCTTPPPMQSWQPAAQPTVVTVVCETPSISSQGSNAQTTCTSRPEHSTPSLTFSMARQESPVSDSESMAVDIQMKKPPPSTFRKKSMTTRSRELSVFERAIKDANRCKHVTQKNNDAEQNPFLFFSQDEVVSPPVSKRQKVNKSSTTTTSTTTTTTTTAAEPQSNMYDKHEPSSYVKTTSIRTIKTTTTVVKRIISIETTKEGSDKVIETCSYEEEDDPHIDTHETVKVEKETFVETGNSTYVRQRPRIVPLALDELPRTFPRGKRRKPSTSSDEVPVNKKPRLEVESAAETVDKPTAPMTPASETHLTPGMRVFARWSDNFYYPGELTGSSAAKSGLYYNVLFDDGNKRKVHSDQLIARDSLTIGQHVLAQDPDGFYDPGTIVGHLQSSTNRGYEIEITSSKKRKRYLEKFVILSEEQAKMLVRTNSTNLSRTGSDVSEKSKSCSSRSGGLSKSRDTSAKDTSCSSNELPRREQPLASPKTTSTTRGTSKDDEETPKSSCRKTRKLRTFARLRLGAESSSEGSSEERLNKRENRARRGLLKKPPSLPTRSSPRKTTQSSTNQTESTRSDQDPVPSNNTLFAGLAFLITGCSNPAQKDVSTDSESREEVELDRAHLTLQIETGGGVVLEKFEETQKTEADQCFLVSTSYQRTIKYFQCLAYGIPLVHHIWIHDCCVLNRLQDFKNYLLPAGRSLETDEVIECGSLPRRRILHGLNIYLQGGNEFKTTWSSVVLAAGGHVITKLPNRPGRAVHLQDSELCNVVISNKNHLPQSLEYACETLGIPVVGLEWLFQCLINGDVVGYDTHPRYDYKNISNEDMLK